MKYLLVLLLTLVLVGCAEEVRLYSVTGKIESAQLFCTENCKWLLKIRITSENDLGLTPEQVTVLNASDSRINTLVDQTTRQCTDDKIVCTYQVIHKENIGFVVKEVLGSNGLPELEGSIR